MFLFNFHAHVEHREMTMMYELIFCFFSVGDNSSPYPFVMELWDTVTNNITQVPHPPGFEASRFFRPSMATFDDDSVMLAAAQVFMMMETIC